MSDAPFFILGNPRSGTTMFRLMLHCHSQICVPPECGFAVWWYKKYKDWKPEDGLENSLFKDLMASRKMEYWNLNKEELLKFILDQDPKNYAEVSSLIYKFYAIQNNKSNTIVGDKNTWYIPHIKEIREIFPDSKLIFIVRDGRDVACSYIQIHQDKLNTEYKPQLPKNVDAIANEWNKNNRIALDYFQSTSWKNAIHIKYENLVTAPKVELTKITEFLGLEFEEGMLEFYMDKSEPEEMLLWKPKTKQKPDVSNIGKYKQILSLEQIETFESIAQPILKEFKYL